MAIWKAVPAGETVRMSAGMAIGQAAMSISCGPRRRHTSFRVGWPQPKLPTLRSFVIRICIHNRSDLQEPTDRFRWFRFHSSWE